jgi:hypothetical protein
MINSSSPELIRPFFGGALFFNRSRYGIVTEKNQARIDAHPINLMEKSTSYCFIVLFRVKS